MRKRSRIGLLVILALAGAGACSSSNNPATPTGPNSMALTTTPAAGSILSIGRCGTYFPPECTQAVLVKSDVTVNQSVSGPLLRVSFQKADGTECLFTFSGTPNTGGYPGAAMYLLPQMNIALDQVTTGNWVCSPPFTTTKVVTTLTADNWQGGPIIIQKSFDWSLSWIM